MKKLLSITLLTFYLLNTYAQKNEMVSTTSNYSGFSEEIKTNSLEKWKEFNPTGYYSHPEFGILPPNAPCDDCVEVLSKRSESEKYFVSTSDPSLFYQQKSYGAINIFKNGKWITIDERLKKVNDYLFTSENQVDPTGINLLQKNSFIQTPFGSVQFNQWKLKGVSNNNQSVIATANWADYTVGENGMKVKNIFSGIDLELKFSRGSIKSNFIIRENHYPQFESLVFEDEFTSNNYGNLLFENDITAQRGVGELIFKKNNQSVLEIGAALIFPLGFEKEKSENAEYIIANNKMGIVIPMSWINENLSNSTPLIIDPTVTSSNTLAQNLITGSGYNATCFNGFCTYNLTVPTPANATVTNVQWSFNYRAQNLCYRTEGAVTFFLGTCRSPSQNNLFWFCNTATGGDCIGDNISIFTDVSSCLPAPSCTPQNLNFTMRFHRCFSSGGGCSNTCIGAISPWTMTITGRTLEYTNATPITLNNTTICQGGTINASTAASFGVPPYSYNWSLNSNMSPSNGTGASSTFSFPNSGTFTIYSTVTDACGTVVNSSRTVTVNPSPAVTITPNPQTICAGQGTGLTLTSTFANTSYSWTTSMSGVGGATNGNGAGTGANSTLSLNQILSNNGTVPGTATYTITPTAAGCAGTPVQVVVTVNQVATVTNPGSQTICAGQNTAAINFTGTNGATFNWTNNNTTTGLAGSGTGNIASFTGLNPGTTNNVSTITVTPNFGTCPGTAQSFTITVTPPPAVTTPTSQTICAGASTTAITFSGNATTYNWTNSNTGIGLVASGSGNIASFVATNTGTTPISGTITVTPTSGSCTGTPQTFTITVDPAPTMTTPPDQTICAGQSTTAVVFSGTANATYSWTNNNTATGLGANGTVTVPSFVGTNSTSNSITSTITVTPTLGTCPGTPVTFTITVAITPSVIAPTSQTICAGVSTTAITFSGNATTYNWTNSNTAIGLGASGTGNIASFVGTNTGTTPISGTITVTPTSGSCTGTPQTFTITVDPTPTMISPQDQTICAGQSTTAVIFSGTANATYSWTNNNTATGLGANGTVTVPSFIGTNSTTNSITSTITVTPTLGTCPGTPVTFTITVAITPSVTAPTSQTICAGASTTAITFSGNATTYNWANDNTAIGLGASGTGNIASFVGTNTGTTPISGTITVTPTSGSCTGTPQTFTITINPSVTPTFTQLGPYCLNETPATLPTNSTNTPSITGTWNPSVISTTTVGNQTFTFTPNSGQCATNQTMTITVGTSITPTFTQLGPFCQNTSAPTLPTNSTNTPSITGTWNPATINTATIGTTNYTFTPNPNQCAANTTMTIEIISNPTISMSPQTICAGQTVTITPTISPTGGTYLWSNNQTTSSITVTPPTTTNYSLLYVINGCNATSTVTITVNPNVNPTFNPMGPYCQNETPDVLNTTSNNSITGTWNPSTINTSTAGNQTYTFTPTTGVCATTSTLQILVNPQVTPTFNAIGPLCQNAANPALPNSSNNTPPITGTWNPASISTTTLGLTNYTFTPNIGQCASNANISVEIIPTPNPTINTNLTSGCAPLTVQLSTESITNATYSWSANGVNIGSTSTLNSTFNNPGCYTISLTTSLGTCQGNSTSTNLICVEGAPSTYFSVFPPFFSNSSEFATFNNSTTGATSYTWDFGDGLTSTDFNPTHIYTNINGNILATLTATSPLGCTSSYSVVITYKDETIFYVPNSFTPDEDEFNQTWGPVFTKGFDAYNFSLYIYNRWGELIWESNDANARWDGSYGVNGVKCPQGVYSWKINFKPTETDEKLTINGIVNLLR